MIIVDYIYYRLYRMYKKYNEPARFSSSLMFGMLGVISFFFVSIVLDKYLFEFYFLSKDYELIHAIITVSLIGITITIWIFLRYTPARTSDLLKKFKGSILNKIIPNWVIVALPLLEFLLGLLLLKTFL
ncbi:hypothetical protein DW039_02295 [Bacteroides sp. AF39-16AC]|uniref:hypothetical protein n=1 Tax=Bacteroides sp. AF39-16AC TaxID=2292936 RepID=UPI000EA1429F|nr:hypothetical protein [Bacteroides sp. AF39-16AC]RJU16160.1 hypothetical protein DW039_02295 [Bacteroides sp. AF39-16AC]